MGLSYMMDTAEPTSSIEHTATRDIALDFVYACAVCAMHLSRWAEQWIIYMTTEFGFIRIADRYTTSSSMMPQKRNPDMLELIRGRCGNVYGDLFALMTILKGLPIGYNRDLQEDKRIVFRAYDTVSSCLTMAAAIVNSAHFKKENIEPTLEKGFLDATSLAEYLVTKGVPFRTAHHVVGTLVAQCEKQGEHALAQLTLDDFNATLKAHGAAVGLDPDVYTCLGARNVVARYQSPGAAGGEPLRKQLEEWKKRNCLPPFLETRGLYRRAGGVGLVCWPAPWTAAAYCRAMTFSGRSTGDSRRRTPRSPTPTRGCRVNATGSTPAWRPPRPRRGDSTRRTVSCDAA
jgi:argininosuccinate lyase